MEARDPRKVTLEEYLELDRTSEERFEYVNGELVPMAASPEHNVVKRNLLVALHAALDGQPCFVLPDGQKVATPATRARHYPDASVWCGRPTRDERGAQPEPPLVYRAPCCPPGS